MAKATTTGTMPGMGQRAGGKGMNSSGTTTTYFQGHKVRSETADTVLLYDGDTKVRYMINVAQKTYRIMPDSLGSMAQLTSMFDIKSAVSVAPNGKVQKIAGLSAKGYDYTETVSMSMKAGAFPGGETPKPKTNATKAAPIPMMVVKIQGQQWVAPVAGLPSNVAQLVSNSSGMGQLTKMVPGLDNLVTKLQAIQGYPVASHQEITMTGLGMAASGGKAGMTFGVDVTTTEIRQSPLPKSLFTIPPGYKLLTSPAGRVPGGMKPAAGLAP